MPPTYEHAEVLIRERESLEQWAEDNNKKLMGEWDGEPIWQENLSDIYDLD